MFMILFVSIGAVVSVLLTFAIINNIDKIKAIQRRLTPAEEALFELHPTVSPYTSEITEENVRDVIDMTIEDGFDHPALAARKVQG